jgi:phosphate transport system permease protein
MAGFPEGSALKSQIARRHLAGRGWRVVFIAATVTGIIALATLLFTIINDSFGLVAVQNSVSPSLLALRVDEGRLLAAPGTLSSEDDELLAQGVMDDPNGIGFFGYAYYREHQESLRAVAVDGTLPSQRSAEDGTYPLSRPLYLYTSASILQEKPQVAAFLSYYVQNVNEQVLDVGYFPVSEAVLAADAEELLGALGEEGSVLPTVSPERYDEPIAIAGSSTVFPLTERILSGFAGAGYSGAATLESAGSTAGLRRFCVEADTDIANASRPIQVAEYETCRSVGREPLELRVGTDTLVVVVNPQNSFLQDVTLDELRQIFSTAIVWADVNPAWPAEPISRYVPGQDSGTLDFFTETVFQRELADLSKAELVDVLAASISSGLGRRLERDQLFFEDKLVFETPDGYNQACAADPPASACSLPARDQEDVYHLVVERVVRPDVVAAWTLADSILRRPAVLAEAQADHPNAEVEFRSWLSGTFITSPQSSTPEFAGVRTAILGTLWVIVITILFSFPVGVGAAIYLEEYATDNRLNRLIQTNINNLAGVPSIIYGMLGLAIFVRALERITSGSSLGLVQDAATANGRTILSAGLTLGLLILPIIIISAQEAIRAVPNSMRQASLGLGATQWQTIWHHVLPSAFSGILTGTILAMSRAIGETAPLVVVGASTFITVDPDGPFSKFTVLPIQIYQWTSRPQAEFRNIAAAAIIVLLVLLIALNASAVLLRQRFSRR